MAESANFLLPDPDYYIYLHHVKNNRGTYGVVILLPTYSESVNDSINVKFNSETPLSRSAPIFSYENSGPRSILVSFKLHRDMMYQLNKLTSNASVNISSILDLYSAPGVQNDSIDYIDYVDVMAREILAAALPSYNASLKMVNPPLVSMKLGNDIFITGVVDSKVGVSYGLPMLRTRKYACVDIDFSITEVIPFEANSIMQLGSFRGMNTSDLFSRTKYVYGSEWTSESGLSTVHESSYGIVHGGGGGGRTF